MTDLVQIHHLPWEGDTDSLNLQTVCTPNSVGRWQAGQAPGEPLQGPLSMWGSPPPSTRGWPGKELEYNSNIPPGVRGRIPKP